jgi:hypothetical protein
MMKDLHLSSSTLTHDPNICLQGMFVFFFLQAKYVVAFVGVNLFACVVVVFFLWFLFWKQGFEGKKKGLEVHRRECVCESVS